MENTQYQVRVDNTACKKMGGNSGSRSHENRSTGL